MRPLESELHQVLEETAPDAYAIEDQARIVATAAAIYRRIERTASKKSGKLDPNKIHEARMIDSLLQAMGALEDWSDSQNYTENYIDGRGLSVNQILSRASHTLAGNRYAKDFSMDILNDDELDKILNPKYSEDDNYYDIDDDHDDRHPSNLFFTPGTGHHKTDSISRGGY